MGHTPETILIAEDDAAVRRFFENALTFEGYRVLTARNGAEALRVLNHEIPALVLLDLAMPSVNGIEVLVTMRENARLREVPVLVVTGTLTTEHDLLPYRPVTVVHKPVKLDSLGSLIQQMLPEGSSRV